MQRIREYLNILNLPCTDQTLDKFEQYFLLLSEWNEKFNLTAIVSKDDVILKHFIDSITAVKLIPNNAKVLDVGSGAGFPAIPLKLIRDDLDITMADSLLKRVNFLQHVIDSLQLKNIRAIHSRAEDLKGGHREGYHTVVARAVAPLNILLEYTIPFAKVNGNFIAYKSQGAQEELALSDDALRILKSEVKSIHKFNLPDTDIERVLIEFIKTGKTLDIYPREKNLPRKKPL